MLILTPGPTMIHAESLKRIGRQVISHRSEKFKKIFKDILNNLKRAFYTTQYVAVLSGSGTLGVDAMVYNLVSPGDNVLVLESGEFGKRLLSTVRIRGANVTVLSKPPGESFKPRDIEDKIKNFDCVLLVYTETSTGAKIKNLKKIVEIAKENGALVGIDATSAFLGEELYFDDWGLDVVSSASHKNLGAPPGLAFVALSEEGLKKAKENRGSIPPYLYLPKYIDFHEKRCETPFTPPINVIYGMRESLELLFSEGIEQRIQRYSQLRDYLYNEFQKMSIQPFPKKEFWSNNVVAVKIRDALKIKEELEKRNIYIATGMGEFKNEVLRIGIMGFILKKDIDQFLKHFRDIFIKLQP